MTEETVISKIEIDKHVFHEDPMTTILAIGARTRDVARADILATEVEKVLPNYPKVEGSYWKGEYTDRMTGQSQGESWTLCFNREDGNFDQVVVTKNNTTSATGIIVSLDVDETGLTKVEVDFKFVNFQLDRTTGETSDLTQIDLPEDSPLTPLIRKLAGISEKVDGGMDKNLAPNASNAEK